MKFLDKIKGLPGRAKYNIDTFLTDKWGFSAKQRHLTWHYMQVLKDQVLAVIPISLLQVRTAKCTRNKVVTAPT